MHSNFKRGMFPTVLDESFRVVLDSISANFQENLRRGFNNEGVRIQDSQKNKNIPINDVALSEKGVFYGLRKISLLTYPEFRVKRFDVDLKNATINVNFYVGTLRVEAEQQVVAKTMFLNLNSASSTNMVMEISGVEAAGRIGLFQIEDSFVPKNYCIDYYYESAEFEHTSQNLIRQTPEKTTFNSTDFSPASLIFPNIKEKLSSLLHRQLSAVISEYSVNELLLEDEDEILLYKNYLHQRTLNANEIIDNLVNLAKTDPFFKDAEYPADFDLSYKLENSSTRGEIQAIGIIVGAGNLTRPFDWSFVDNNNEIILFGFLDIKDYKFLFEYKTEYYKSQIEGKINACIYKSRIAVELKISRDSNPFDSNNINMEIWELNDVEVDISGIGPLRSLEKEISRSVLSVVQMETNSIIKNYITLQFNEILESKRIVF